MRIEALGSLDLSPTINNGEKTVKAVPSFSNWLKEQLIETNHQLITADHALQQLARGEAASLHQTMLHLEQAKLSFQFLEQIRNRLMSAYQELLREQI